jgi:hypothetical protein
MDDRKLRRAARAAGVEERLTHDGHVKFYFRGRYVGKLANAGRGKRDGMCVQGLRSALRRHGVEV